MAEESQRLRQLLLRFEQVVRLQIDKFDAARHYYPMKTLVIYCFAAIFEIAGCFSFWAWLKLHKSPWWIAPGVVSLILFAYLVTLVNSDAAGRTYAAYGAIYIASSIAWLWLVERQMPDRWDIAGLIICLVGASVILFGLRPSS